MTNDERIRRNLKLHTEIMKQLQNSGMSREDASKEAMRRMRDKKFKFGNWQDYFTAVELEGFSLPHE